MPKKLTNKARIELRAATIRNVKPEKCCWDCDYFSRYPVETSTWECRLPVKGDVISPMETTPFWVCDAHTQEE